MAGDGESAQASAARPDQQADQRAAQRFTLLLLTAKLVAPVGEFLCILRDLSATGLKARLFHALPDVADWQLELGSGARHSLEPVWQADGYAGFRFGDAPVDPHRLMDEDAGPFPKRHIRLRLKLPVMLWADGAARAGRLCDVSQLGAQVEADPPLALRQLVRVEAPGLPLRHARVLWRRGTAHGLVFHHAFRLDELAVLAARLQGDGLAAASGPIHWRINQ
ncbi:PilZ domain-containing protein [Novosphingobium sp.]|uniref:PilZ domain-containing protein n=1 Tax=Novosphingobium sp. TaxID=1874826 RepID=UPI002732F2DF|nr:PilZ domain-containing protein [Novosphingobium sp.]MDP3906437.1 PilZ domain-containing protein [Novosphingobium sp.]